MIHHYDGFHPINIDSHYAFLNSFKVEVFEFYHLAKEVIQCTIDAPINIIYNIDTCEVSEIILN